MLRNVACLGWLPLASRYSTAMFTRKAVGRTYWQTRSYDEEINQERLWFTTIAYSINVEEIDLGRRWISPHCILNKC